LWTNNNFHIYELYGQWPQLQEIHQFLTASCRGK
jgi:hypothetical protein